MIKALCLRIDTSADIRVESSLIHLAQKSTLTTSKGLLKVR